MASDSRKLNVVVNSNVNGALRGFSRMSTAASSMGRGVMGTFRGIATAAAVAGTAIIAGIGGAFKLAMESSNVNEALNRTKVVFEEAAGSVIKFSESSAKSYGIAQSSALQFASQFGQILGVTEMTTEEIAKMSINLVEFSGDLSSFANLSTDDALQKVFSGLAGEIEPLRREGVAMDAATISALALEAGLAAVNSELSQGDKIATRANFILGGDNSLKIVGDFERTKDDLAQQFKIVKALFKDFMADIGGNFIPIFSKLFGHLAANAEEWGESINESIGNGITKFKDILKENEPEIQAVVGRMGDVWSAYKNVMGVVWGVIFDNWPQIKESLVSGFRAIDDVIQNSLIPTFKEIYEEIKTRWPELKALLIPLLAEIQNTFTTTVETIKAVWAEWGDDFMRIAAVAVGATIAIVTITLQAIQLFLALITGLMSGDWSTFWASLEAITGVGTGNIERSLGAWAERVRGKFQAWGESWGQSLMRGLSGIGGWLGSDGVENWGANNLPGWGIAAGLGTVADGFAGRPSTTTITEGMMDDYNSSQQINPYYSGNNSYWENRLEAQQNPPIGKIYITRDLNGFADLSEQHNLQNNSPNVGSSPFNESPGG